MGYLAAREAVEAMVEVAEEVARGVDEEAARGVD